MGQEEREKGKGGRGYLQRSQGLELDIGELLSEALHLNFVILTALLCHPQLILKALLEGCHLLLNGDDEAVGLLLVVQEFHLSRSLDLRLHQSAARPMSSEKIFQLLGELMLPFLCQHLSLFDAHSRGPLKMSEEADLQVLQHGGERAGGDVQNANKRRVFGIFGRVLSQIFRCPFFLPLPHPLHDGEGLLVTFIQGGLGLFILCG
jgi:hypothetical protein